MLQVTKGVTGIIIFDIQPGKFFLLDLGSGKKWSPLTVTQQKSFQAEILVKLESSFDLKP